MKKKPLPPVFNALVEEYHRHLVDCAGLAGATCRNHIHYVRRFLRENRKKLGRQLGFQRLRPPDPLAYVRRKSRSSPPGSLHGVTTTLRSFFRFLSLTGRCSGSLSGAVPKVSARRGGGLPRHLTPEQLKQLLQSPSEPKPGVIRSRAIVLCLSKLGLRAGEVARLRLDDINWRGRALSLPSTKGRRSRLLPLTDQVASYRDTFRLLLRFVQRESKRAP
jgi:site-specific recombinase XerD